MCLGYAAKRRGSSFQTALAFFAVPELPEELDAQCVADLDTQMSFELLIKDDCSGLVIGAIHGVYPRIVCILRKCKDMVCHYENDSVSAKNRCNSYALYAVGLGQDAGVETV